MWLQNTESLVNIPCDRFKIDDVLKYPRGIAVIDALALHCGESLAVIHDVRNVWYTGAVPLCFNYDVRRDIYGVDMLEAAGHR